jgi:hypothetical protein
MSDLRGTQPTNENALADEFIADSPLREVDPASIDELLDRVNEHLIAGVPSALRANDDEILKKMVDAFRREAAQWAIAEQTKKPRSAKKPKDPVDLNHAIVI